MSKGFITKDSGKRQEFTAGMERDTQDGKPRYDLCYLPVLTRWAELMARGAEKYNANNWMKAEGQEEFDRFKASAFRHFIQFINGEEDEDHLSATIFNMCGMDYVKDKMKK